MRLEVGAAVETGFLREPECQNIQQLLQLAEESASASAYQPARVGDQVGDYQLIEVLGKGGMGIVYRAQHVRLKKDVALKLISDAAIHSPKSLQRFEREMQAIGQLEHPNVVNALDAGDFEGRPFLTMELIRGFDLTQLIKAGDSLPVADACELVRQAAVGLQYAHDRQLIHRDVKPANLMLTVDPLGEPNVKVMDLGLAQITEAGTDELTDQGQLMGTLKYMAPEQAAGDGRVDFKADIYALGATLFHLLTGDVPFGGPEHNTPVKRLQSLTTQAAPTVAARRDDLPSDLVALVDQMLDRHVANRPESMQQLAAQLAKFCDGHSLQKLAQTTPTTPAFTRAKTTEVKSDANSDPKRKARPTFPLKWILSILCCLAICSGVIWLRQTDGSYLRIDADPTIDVSIELIEDGELVETFQVGKNRKQIWCKSGKYKVRLPAGVKDSLTLEGADLTVTRGENTVVRIRRISAADLAKQVTDATSRKTSEPGRTARPTAREAVERVLSKDGRAVVMVDGKRIHIDGTSQIPKVPFEFRGVASKHSNSLNDDDCQFLAQFNTIDQLELVWSDATEDGFKNFAGRKQILSLSIPRALPRSDSIAALFPNLRYVSPAYPEIEDFTVSIRNNPGIVVLRVYRSQMPAIACSNVAAMPNLKFLDAEDAELKGEDIRLISKSTTLQHLRMTLHGDMDVSELAPLAHMKTLKSIRVDGPASSPGRHDFAQEIKMLLPQCEYITDEARHNQIRDDLIYATGTK